MRRPAGRDRKARRLLGVHGPGANLTRRDEHARRTDEHGGEAGRALNVEEEGCIVAPVVREANFVVAAGLRHERQRLRVDLREKLTASSTSTVKSSTSKVQWTPRCVLAVRVNEHAAELSTSSSTSMIISISSTAPGARLPDMAATNDPPRVGT